MYVQCRVVSRFFGRRLHPKSRWLFPFYFSNITLRTDLLTFGVTGAVVKIAGEMHRLPPYFDNPDSGNTDFCNLICVINDEVFSGQSTQKQIFQVSQWD